MPTYRLVAAIACGALGGALACLACSSFGNDTETTSNAEAGADGASSGSPDGATSSGGSSGAQADGLYLTCPPTSTRSTFQNLSRQLVVNGAGDDYPFAIVTDATSIYWVSQLATTGAQKTDAYNGHLKARIHRAPKGQVTSDGASTVIVEGENEGVIALALDGDHVYWAAPKSTGSTTLSIRRVARTCAKPCSVESIAEITSPQPIVFMRRAKPGLIFALGGDGKVFAIEPATKSAGQISAGAGDLPNFAVAEDHAFVAGAFNSKVLRVAKDSSKDHASFAPTDSNEKGCGAMATDCARIYAWRKLDSNLWAADATSASSFSKLADLGQTGVYDVFADKDYVYVGSLNGGGITVIDHATGAVVRKYPGSYFRLWADDTGLYGGEHDTGGPPGAIYRFSD